MLEVEIKFRCWDHAALEQELQHLGATGGAPRTEEDHYFNAPDRDFAQTDEAIRLRRIGEANFVTYKGPKTDPLSKTRQEIEVPVGPGSEAAAKFSDLLAKLGYQAVAVVRKDRRIFHLHEAGRDVEVCLDHVDQVGDFAELELQARPEEMEQSRSVLFGLAAKLGLAQPIRRSYLEMLLASRSGDVLSEKEPERSTKVVCVPRLVKGIAEARVILGTARRSGRRIGLVPTMGALHEGHVSLIRAAREQTEFVVVSIFVNPKQFGPNEDFARYPRSFEQDLEACAREKVDLVFAPEVGTMYPAAFRTAVDVDGWQQVLEGQARPGHFGGVATVVLKLFDIVQPHIAYFGQKDAQQVRIVQQLTADLNVPVEIHVCPTVREPDGLAVSSRNRYLSSEQRRHAVCLFQALQEAWHRIHSGERDAGAIARAMQERIKATPGVVLDYVAVVDHETLQPVQWLSGKVLVAVAARIGTTRLIDNIIVDPTAQGTEHDQAGNA